MPNLRWTSSLALFAAVALAACGSPANTVKDCSLPGSTACGGTCVNLQEDQAHCGTCNHACAAGQVCSAGTCSLSCQAGLVNCGGKCVDPLTDRAFCGASGTCTGATAGTACLAGQVCSGGACALSCQAGLVNCGGKCVDPQSDRAFCGASGTCTGADAGSACLAGQACVAGACACAAGFSDCSGVCRDLQADAANCGVCGTVCPDGQTCSAGACVGVMLSVRIADLTGKGWVQCYLDTFSVSGATLTTAIPAACTNANVLVGCRPTGSQTLSVAAFAPRADVFFVTGNPGASNATHLANGVAWYFDNSFSMGFARGGDTVSLTSCDTASVDATRRVCFHTSAVGGYRCGADLGLNSSTAWERIVFHRN